MMDDNNNSKLADCFSGCLYFSAGSLYRHIDRIATEIFKPLDLAPSHAFLLMALTKSPQQQACPSTLADEMLFERSTISRLIARLEAKGLVEKRREGIHTFIVLQPKGEELIAPIKEAWSKLYERFSAEFGEEQAKEANKRISALVSQLLQK
jgi:DNA-binding MarR family transcriptional regulator